MNSNAHVKILAVALLVLAMAPKPASADVGLDSDFGLEGIMRTVFPALGTTTSEIRALAIQQSNGSDVQCDRHRGEIVAVGEAKVWKTGSVFFALTRYNPDSGKLDETFGRVTTGFDINTGGVGDTLTSDATASAVAIQPDGKIVAVGTATVGKQLRFAVVRYLCNGKLDTSFGKGGGRTVDFATGAGANAVAIQDGKIVVVGTSGGGNSVFTLVRLDDKGVNDPTFGPKHDGINTTPFPNSSGISRAAAIAVKIDGAGRIVVSGTSVRGQSRGFALVRYDRTTGEQDRRFGENGQIITDVDGVDLGARTLEIQDNRLVVTGASDSVGGRLSFAIAVYDPVAAAGPAGNKFLDRTFNKGSVLIVDFPFPSPEGAAAVRILPDNRIVAAGGATVTSPKIGHSAFVMTRRLSAGVVDSSFSDSSFKDPGKVVTVLNVPTSVNAMLVLPNGSTVIAGGYNNSFMLARYEAR